MRIKCLSLHRQFCSFTITTVEIIHCRHFGKPGFGFMAVKRVFGIWFRCIQCNSFVNQFYTTILLGELDFVT